MLGQWYWAEYCIFTLVQSIRGKFFILVCLKLILIVSIWNYFKVEGSTQKTRKLFGPAISFKTRILIPLNEVDRLHWTFVDVRIAEKCIIYHDSYHDSGIKILEMILDFIESEAKKFRKSFDRSSWSLTAANDMPKQIDTYR